jgi:hypothetical protein
MSREFVPDGIKDHRGRDHIVVGFATTYAISGLSVLLVEETGVPGENHKPVTDKLYHIMLYTSP